jgi:flavin reductase (DIM6/NTAB) family NADH-FMN oxidoreductase RutF
MIIDPKELPLPKLQGYLQGAVSPRPIALASTIDEAGEVNLSPFSFFNLFSTNPPIVIFSPSRRVRNNTTKHTYENVKVVPEVVINIVSYDMVQQVSLASCEYPRGVNEFAKAGLTEVSSKMVRPPRVGESRVSLECKVNQVIELGTQGGAGNLIICEIVLMHIKEEVLDEHGRIDPQKMDSVARMGGDYYVRAKGENVFTVPKPNEKLGIGFDGLPAAVRNSAVLTGNDLGRLANIEQLPDPASIQLYISRHPESAAAASRGVDALHQLAQRLLNEGKLEEAWKTILGFGA